MSSVDFAKYGHSPLMQAAEFGHTEIVSLLIQNKAEIGLRNNVRSPQVERRFTLQLDVLYKYLLIFTFI